MSQSSESSFARLMRDLWETKDYSDLILKSGDAAHHVHRMVVCKMSPVLARMDREAASADSGIEMKVSPEVLNQIIRFMYLDDYEDNFYSAPSPAQESRSADDYEQDSSSSWQQPTPTGTSVALSEADESEVEKVDESHPEEGGQEDAHTRLRASVNMYLAALIYDMPKLAELAVEKFNAAAEVNSSTEDILESVGLYYDKSVEEESPMKASLLATVKSNMELLKQSKDFREVMTSHARFGYDLVMYLCESQEHPTSANSEACSEASSDASHDAQSDTGSARNDDAEEASAIDEIDAPYPEPEPEDAPEAESTTSLQYEVSARRQELEAAEACLARWDVDITENEAEFEEAKSALADPFISKKELKKLKMKRESVEMALAELRPQRDIAAGARDEAAAALKAVEVKALEAAVDAASYELLQVKKDIRLLKQTDNLMEPKTKNRLRKLKEKRTSCEVRLQNVAAERNAALLLSRNIL